MVDHRAARTTPNAPPPSADVVIVGSGIMGCAAAYHLSRAGLSVVVLEKGRIAGQQSTRAWGFVRVQARDTAEIPLATASLGLWRTLEAELECDLGWREGGCLFVANDEAGLAEQEEWLDLARPYQVRSRIIGPDEVAKTLPGLSRRALGGLYTATDGHAEPRLVAPAFARRAADLGASVMEGVGLTEIDVSGGCVSGVVTEAGPIRTDTVIVTAGASTRAILDTIGLDLPQQYVRGTVARTNRVPALTSAAVTGFGVGFRQRSDGSLNIADELQSDVDLTLGHLRALRLFLPGLIQHRRGFSVHINRALVDDLRMRVRKAGSDEPLGGPRDPTHLPAAWRMRRASERLMALFPHAGRITPVEQWGALIDCTPDGLPVIDAIGPRGLLVATGFTAHGFALGPIVGKLLAEMVTTGRSSIDLRPFRFSRFAEGDVKLPYAL